MPDRGPGHSHETGHGPGPGADRWTAPVREQVRPGAPVRRLLADHGALAGAARAVLAHVDGARTRVAEQVLSERAARARTELGGLTVDRLTEVTDKNLRVRALLDAGYTTVGSLLGVTAQELELIDGVGPHTARSTVAAVEQLADATAEGLSLRITLDRDDPSGTRLLENLSVLLRLGPLVEPHRADLADYAGAVERLLVAAEPAANAFTLRLRRRATRSHALDAVASLDGWEPWLRSTGIRDLVARLTAACAEPGPGPLALWDDFERRSPVYYTALGEIVPLARDVLAAQGMLPSELADRVAETTLDTSLLDVSLRGYQAFGAKFVLNQGRVLLGDEMGLGKTVQAIAVMAHRAAQGDTHALVVCPASVLVGWLREIEARSSLRAWRLHGPGREAAAAGWVEHGGVAVTTFEGLRHLALPAPVPGLTEVSAAGDESQPGLTEVSAASSGAWDESQRGAAPDQGRREDASPADALRLDLLVVDEAHLVKNPRAQRSQDVAAWAQRCWRVLLMTGTPLENRLDEFLGLVRLLQPSLVDTLPAHLRLVGADVLRNTMAPVYLRRNAADVLVELPELVELDEWEELSPAGEAVYAQAVAAGRFMDMRRADFATADPAGSSKLGRLLEILEDADANGEKVVVFSSFRDVVDLVRRTVEQSRPGMVFGPLWGGVPADARQEAVDRFTEAPPGAVLVAQVDAGGVGLNIQAANVVVLCEPQLKPTTEAQAVARVLRMGQVRTVRVHRLLVADSVDERIRELLATKARVFDEYVRESSLAAVTTRAVDVSEAALARDVVTAEQTRLGYGPVWDELDLAPASPPASPDEPAGLPPTELRARHGGQQADQPLDERLG